MIKNDPRTYAIIGAAMEVHRLLGCGFLEAVYQEALAMEMKLRAIPFVQQVELPVFYKDFRLEASYRPDFVCFEYVIVELKALNQITAIETSQLINYLKASNYQIGLLLNFGAPSLQYKRYIFTNDPSKAPLLDVELGA